MTATPGEFKSALNTKTEKEPLARVLFLLELLSRLELPNLILTKDALYRLSYSSRCFAWVSKPTHIIIPLFFKICNYFLFYSLNCIVDGFRGFVQGFSDFHVAAAF